MVIPNPVLPPLPVRQIGNLCTAKKIIAAGRMIEDVSSFLVVRGLNDGFPVSDWDLCLWGMALTVQAMRGLFMDYT